MRVHSRVNIVVTEKTQKEVKTIEGETLYYAHMLCLTISKPPPCQTYSIDKHQVGDKVNLSDVFVYDHFNSSSRDQLNLYSTFLGPITITKLHMKQISENEEHYLLEAQVDRTFGIPGILEFQNPRLIIHAEHKHRLLTYPFPQNQTITRYESDISVVSRVQCDSVILGKITKISLDLCFQRLWNIVIEPEDFLVSDILRYFSPSGSVSENWIKSLNFDNISLQSIQVGVSSSDSFSKVHSLSLDMKVFFLNKFEMLVSFSEEDDDATMFCDVISPHTVHELLSWAGVKPEHYKLFPNVCLVNMQFSFSLSEETSYHLSSSFFYGHEGEDTTFDIFDNITIKLGDVYFEIDFDPQTGFSINCVIECMMQTPITISGQYGPDGFIFTCEAHEIDLSDLHLGNIVGLELPVLNNVTIQSSPFSVRSRFKSMFQLEIMNQIVQAQITEVEYSADQWKVLGKVSIFDLNDLEFCLSNGFISIRIEHLSLKSILKSVISFDDSLIGQRFNVDLNHIAVEYEKEANSFKATAELESLKFGSNIELTNNQFQIFYHQSQLSLIITTNLCINIFGNKLELSGGRINVNPSSISLFTRSQSSIKDIFTIKGLDIENFYVSLEEVLKPPGMHIGFMNQLRFKDLNGTIAIYFTAESTGEELLFINFNGISVYQIIESFVENEDTTIKDVLESISIQPITLITNYQGEIEDIPKAIQESDHSNEDEFVFLEHDQYEWIDPNTVIIDNKRNLKRYFVLKEEDHYEVLKYVSFYFSNSPHGIVMNDVTFKPGLQFSGKLCFLGSTAIIDFEAMKGSGITIYAELEQSIRLGALLLCRVEDREKGPILSLSTYDDNRHLYLYGKISITDLFNIESRILFSNNQFNFLFKGNVLGVSSTISAQSSFAKLSSASFDLSIVFETSGFGQVTEAISSFLKDKADKLNQATKTAEEKINNAILTLNEVEQRVSTIRRDRDDKSNYLNTLVHTRYKWYEAYKYIILALRVSSVNLEISALESCCLSVLSVFKAAELALQAAKELMKIDSSSVEFVIDGVGELISIIGKSIDWLVKLNKIWANINLNTSSMLLELGLDFDLCGKNHKGSLELSLSSDIFRSIIDYIHQECLQNKSVQALSDVYTRLAINSLDLNQEINTLIDDPEPYINHFECFENDFNQLKTMFSNMSGSVRTVNSNDINSLVSDLNNSIQSSRDFLQFQEMISQDELDKIEKFTQASLDKIKEKGTLAESEKNQNKEITIHDNKNHEMISRSQEALHQILSNCIVDVINKDIIICDTIDSSLNQFEKQNQAFSKEELKIIKAYESITEEASTFSPLTKSIFFAALGEAYSEICDFEKSNIYFESSLTIIENTFGKYSKEYEEAAKQVH